MQNDLIMNQIPLPKHFDGLQWNTVLKPTRKSIPKYLHEDLPQLRHLYIKQIFKQMGKFSVPNLEFFNNMIKQKHKKPQNNRQKGQRASSMGKDKKLTYNQVKEEFQYALLLMDKDSNVMDELVEKAQHVQGSSLRNGKSKNSESNPVKSFRSRATSLNKTKQSTKTKYFDNTVDLVFRNRRNKYLQNLKKPPEIEEIPEIFQKRFQELGLIDIQNPNL